MNESGKHSDPFDASVAIPTATEVTLSWLARNPLVPPAVGMMAGIAVDAAMPPCLITWALVFTASAGLLAAVRRQVVWGHMGLALASMAVGGVLHDTSFRQWPENHLARFCGAASTRARVMGTVVSSPAIRPVNMGRVTWRQESPRTHFLVEAEQVKDIHGWTSVSGLLAVRIREPALHVNAGDRVELLGRLYRPSPPSNPGERDWRLIRQRDGVLVEMSVDRSANVVVLGPGHKGRHVMAFLRHRLRMGMLDDTLPANVPGSSLLSALVLGQRSNVDPATLQAFVDTGTVHYLSVSGAHVGMLASAVWLIGFLIGASRRTCAVWTMLLVTCYAVVAEPRPAIWRATLMADLLCLSILLRRPIRSANWLALAAIMLLAIKPTQLFAPGFQLSFCSVASIMFVGPRLRHLITKGLRYLRGVNDPLLSPEIQKRLHPPSRLTRLTTQCSSVLVWWLAISGSAWIAGTLLSIYYFHQLTWWGWLNSLLIMPMIWLILVTGFSKTLLSFVLPQINPFLGHILNGLTNALVAIVEQLARIPGTGVPTPAVEGWVICLGFAVVVFLVTAPWRRMKARYVALAVILSGGAATWSLMPASHNNTFRLTMLSVGNGTCCLIHLPDGNTWIHDAGAQPPYDIVRWTIEPALARERVYSIETVILSHANLDHYSGLPDLLHRYRVGRIVASTTFTEDISQNSSVHRLLAEIQNRGTPWRTAVRGDRLVDDEATRIEVLWPPSDRVADLESVNDQSLVLRIIHHEHRVLICGDIGEEPQQYLIDQEDLHADVLVLPHHGAVVSNTATFISAVNPTWCIRSSGQHDMETRNGLMEILSARHHYNTADDGAVLVQLNPEGIEVEPVRHRSVEWDEHVPFAGRTPTPPVAQD